MKEDAKRNSSPERNPSSYQAPTITDTIIVSLWTENGPRVQVVKIELMRAVHFDSRVKISERNKFRWIEFMQGVGDLGQKNISLTKKKDSANT